MIIWLTKRGRRPSIGQKLVIPVGRSTCRSPQLHGRLHCPALATACPSHTPWRDAVGHLGASLSSLATAEMSRGDCSEQECHSSGLLRRRRARRCCNWRRRCLVVVVPRRSGQVGRSQKLAQRDIRQRAFLRRIRLTPPPPRCPLFPRRRRHRPATMVRGGRLVGATGPGQAKRVGKSGDHFVRIIINIWHQRLLLVRGHAWLAGGGQFVFAA